ncbi:MAG: tetratricopeptide repeat protein [Anaerolineae bacterium]
MFRQQRGDEAVDYLQQAVAVAREQRLQAQIALAQRLLGEALTALSQFGPALDSLQSAHASLVEMGMSLEQAICLVALGNCYLNLSQPVAGHRILIGKRWISKSSCRLTPIEKPGRNGTIEVTDNAPRYKRIDTCLKERPDGSQPLCERSAARLLALNEPCVSPFDASDAKRLRISSKPAKSNTSMRMITR